MTTLLDQGYSIFNTHYSQKDHRFLLVTSSVVASPILDSTTAPQTTRQYQGRSILILMTRIHDLSLLATSSMITSPMPESTLGSITTRSDQSLSITLLKQRRTR